MANTAIRKAGQHAFAHRRDKKNDFRKLWNVRINAGLRVLGTTYSKFIDKLTKKNISLNRKMLAELALNRPESFKRVVEEVQK